MRKSSTASQTYIPYNHQPLSLKQPSTTNTHGHIPRYYFFTKKIRNLLPFLLLILCMFKTTQIYLTTEINQSVLEHNALIQNKHSSFNPKNILLDLFNHIIDIQEESKPSSFLGKDQGIFFHWDDWIDLGVANHLLNKARVSSSSGTFCDANLKKFGDVNGHFLESYNTKIYRGMVNLYCLKDIPEKLLINTDSTIMEVPVIGKKRLAANDDKSINSVTTDHLITKMNRINTTSDQFNYKNIESLEKTVDINPEDFIFKPDVEIFQLQEKLNNQTITSKEMKYLEFLEYSNNHLVDHTDRYFKYAWIYTDLIQGNSHHISYPFFKRYISDRERQSILHHMIRNWFQFSQAYGFASWINHGSLLGWAFNGFNMPWDTDIDIQMPIAQLDKLAKQFNKTLIIENPKFGNARYWLEIAPTYIRQGNGKSFIDARFIDINSGLYIDITALSHTEVPPPETNDSNDLSQMSVHCKNWNWHTLDELLPIRHTYFEGASVYIPNKVNQSLMNKYGKSALTNTEFHKHNYQKDIDMWVPNKICSRKPKKPKNRFEKNKKKLSLKGACNSKILQDEYNIIREIVERHKLLNEDLDNSAYYNIDEMGDLPIFRKDSWDYYYDINHKNSNIDNWYVRKQITRK
ncbi:unnamed protein product [Candida verbasci]|uniref:LicD/FKTN/FKRP nucleotidyltransferase domain-containing protein n=1 Tax=Candida verbasci TaxID=1227364 RepID=A0A9W4XKA7_9ASCO|nr:unnamed protein product [Candida verbasci]